MLASASTLTTAVPLASCAAARGAACSSSSAAPRLPCRPVRRVHLGQQRLVRVIVGAAGQQGGEWAQTSSGAEYSVPDTTATGQISNEQYAAFHGREQYASMQPASLTSTMGFRGLNLPNAIRGPSSVVIAFAMVAFTVFTAIRQFLMRRTKNCQTCKSYGIVRCTLCAGQGNISWEGKWTHSTLCPGCFGKRHTKCESCGGMHHRSRFAHVQSNAKDPFPAAVAAVTPVPIMVPSIPAAEKMKD